MGAQGAWVYDLGDAGDILAALVTEILNHCGPLTPRQKRAMREAVSIWEAMREDDAATDDG